MTNEPDVLKDGVGTILPKDRNKGGKGYILIPDDPKYQYTLTTEEMSVVLAVYSALLKRKIEQ